MRGTRVKALRETFRSTYGFLPRKASWTRQRVKPRNLFQRFWRWITRFEAPQYWHVRQSLWRNIKNQAKASDREPDVPNLPRGRRNQKGRAWKRANVREQA